MPRPGCPARTFRLRAGDAGIHGGRDLLRSALMQYRQCPDELIREADDMPTPLGRGVPGAGRARRVPSSPGSAHAARGHVPAAGRRIGITAAQYSVLSVADAEPGAVGRRACPRHHADPAERERDRGVTWSAPACSNGTRTPGTSGCGGSTSRTSGRDVLAAARPAVWAVEQQMVASHDREPSRPRSAASSPSARSPWFPARRRDSLRFTMRPATPARAPGKKGTCDESVHCGGDRSCGGPDGGPARGGRT